MQLTSFPLTLQRGTTRLYGHLFIAPHRLYFVCDKKGGVLLAAIGQSLGGAVGGAMIGIGTKEAGAAPPTVDEATVHHACTVNDGSVIMEAAEIQLIKHTVFMRTIRHKGTTYGLPNGLDKPLRGYIAEWAKQNGVKTKGGALKA
jgi:hypothetical protein